MNPILTTIFICQIALREGAPVEFCIVSMGLAPSTGLVISFPTPYTSLFWINGPYDYKVYQIPNLLWYLTHISYKFHRDQASMALATVSNTFGGQFQNLHTVIVLLSLETTLSKATRFNSKNLIDFGKMQVSWEEISVDRKFFL